MSKDKDESLSAGPAALRRINWRAEVEGKFALSAAELIEALKCEEKVRDALKRFPDARVDRTTFAFMLGVSERAISGEKLPLSWTRQKQRKEAAARRRAKKRRTGNGQEPSKWQAPFDSEEPERFTKIVAPMPGGQTLERYEDKELWTIAAVLKYAVKRAERLEDEKDDRNREARERREAEEKQLNTIVVAIKKAVRKGDKIVLSGEQRKLAMRLLVKNKNTIILGFVSANNLTAAQLDDAVADGAMIEEMTFIEAMTGAWESAEAKRPWMTAYFSIVDNERLLLEQDDKTDREVIAAKMAELDAEQESVRRASVSDDARRLGTLGPGLPYIHNPL